MWFGRNIAKLLCALYLLSGFQHGASALEAPASLPVRQPSSETKADWLLKPGLFPAQVYRSHDRKEIVLDNGIVRRTFLLAPNGATVGLEDLSSGTSHLRAVKPEALVTINGEDYEIGGLKGQPDTGYLAFEWLPRMTNNPNAFQLVGIATGHPEADFEWKRKRRADDLPFPANGKRLVMNYRAPQTRISGVGVNIIYEIYDGIPVIAKWLQVSNGTPTELRLDKITTEILGLVEAESAVDERSTNRWRLPPLVLLSDYSFGGMDPVTSSRVAEWRPDPEFTTQVNYHLRTPCVLVARPPKGPVLTLKPGETFKSFGSWLVIYDSDSRERQGLTVRRSQRLLVPWITENPIMMHVRNADSKTFRSAVDQCAAVGFEMIIYTFGSGLNMENLDPDYIAMIKSDVDYAHAKGIEVGAYSLLSSRRIDDENDVINPKTGKTGGAIFGNAPCLGSRWGMEYFRKIKNFIEATGLDLIEHDGPYPGDFCASTMHPGHQGLDDSQYVQWQLSRDFYRWSRSRGIYINAPDYYFFAGSNKTAMGYREDNWSLPRAQQLIHGRMHIFDGTWEKTPTMGWTFVPLTEYHGGGAAATLEPLREHLDDYEAHLANNFGAGVQACYRGPRLFDSEETKTVVAKWVTWFKKHRDILESDIIHGRRADGRDIDWILHVNPKLKTRGLAMIYNPLPSPVERTIHLPLYYTGLTEKALVRTETDEVSIQDLNRDYKIDYKVNVPARGRTWLIIEEP